MPIFKEKRYNATKHTKMIQEFRKVDPFTLRVNRRELLFELLLKHGIHGPFRLSNSEIAKRIYTSNFYVLKLMHRLSENGAIQCSGNTNNRMITVLYENIRDKDYKEFFRK